MYGALYRSLGPCPRYAVWIPALNIVIDSHGVVHVDDLSWLQDFVKVKAFLDHHEQVHTLESEDNGLDLPESFVNLAQEILARQTELTVLRMKFFHFCDTKVL